MTNETAGYGRRLRDLEAEAFRTGRILAEHSGQLATTGEWRIEASGTIEQRLDAIERVLLALARAQGIDTAATD